MTYHHPSMTSKGKASNLGYDRYILMYRAAWHTKLPLCGGPDLHRLTRHFYKRLFPQLKPVT